MELKCYPAAVLRKRTRPVRQIDSEVAARAREMLEFMYEADGIGLAAPQVGWSARVVTLDHDLSRQGDRIFVNPRIVSSEGYEEEEEGCLSLPGLRLQIGRAPKIKVVGYTLAGDRLEFEADGLLARAWQHEMDHINGLLIIDRVLPATRLAVRRQLKALEKEEKAGRER